MSRWAWDVVKVALVVMGLLGLPMVLMPEAVLSSIYRLQPETLEVALWPLRLVGLSMVFEAVGTVLQNALLGAGDTRRVMLTTIASQWLLFLPIAYMMGPFFGLGLTAATPLLALLLKLPVKLLPVMLIALAIGSFGATQIGLIAAALTARLRRSGILLAIIVLPLYLPLLIFGSGAVDAVRLGDSPRAALLLLAAQTLLLTTLAAPAAAAGLRIGSDNPP